MHPVIYEHYWTQSLVILLQPKKNIIVITRNPDSAVGLNWKDTSFTYIHP